MSQGNSAVRPAETDTRSNGTATREEEEEEKKNNKSK